MTMKQESKKLLFVGFVILFFLFGVFDSLGNGESQTIIVGGIDPDDPCVIEIHTITLPQLNQMGLQDWIIACQKAQ